MRLARLFPVGLFLVLTACNSSPNEPGGGRVIGTIDFGGTLDRVIEAPAAVTAGQSFTVTIATFGSCLIPAGAEVAVDGLVATITPYDVLLVGQVCPGILMPFPRPVQLSFGQTGAAIIRVSGASYYQSGLVTVERSLVVSR